jgi:glycosyltransferase involved in cell wall biosynthesis
MRVVFFTLVFPPKRGGMETFAKIFVEAMERKGVEVTVICPQRNSGSGKTSSFPIIGNPFSLSAIKAIKNAHILHLNGNTLKGGTLFLPFLKKKPLLITHHGYQTFCPTGLAWSPEGECTGGPKGGPCPVCLKKGIFPRAKTYLHFLLPHLARKNIAVSRFLENRLKLPRSTVIYNALPPFFFTEGYEEKEDRIVFVGRLVQEKGILLLLSALSLLKEGTLWIIGDGPLRKECESFVEKKGLKKRVIFLGEKSEEETACLMKSATVLCVPTLSPETFGYTVAQGMAMGKAVVGTPVGAIPELIGNKRGFLSPSTTPEGVKETLLFALLNREERSQRGKEASIFARNFFQPEKMAEEYLSLYHIVLKEVQ